MAKSKRKREDIQDEDTSGLNNAKGLVHSYSSNSYSSRRTVWAKAIIDECVKESVSNPQKNSEMESNTLFMLMLKRKQSFNNTFLLIKTPIRRCSFLPKETHQTMQTYLQTVSGKVYLKGILSI